MLKINSSHAVEQQTLIQPWYIPICFYAHQRNRTSAHSFTCAFPPSIYSYPIYIPNIRSFIQAFYSAFSSPLLLKGAPDTARTLCRNFMPKPHCSQLRVKNLPNVPTWRLERDSNPRPQSTNEPPRHHNSSTLCTVEWMRWI